MRCVLLKRYKSTIIVKSATIVKAPTTNKPIAQLGVELLFAGLVPETSRVGSVDTSATAELGHAILTAEEIEQCPWFTWLPHTVT